MRFPSRLLAANLHSALICWAVLTAIVTVVALVIAVFGEITQSVWEQAAQAPRWYALFTGVALVTEFLPLYVAHGQTRRQFAAQTAVTIALLAPTIAAMVLIGYLVETGVYELVGWNQVLDRPHLFGEPSQPHLVFLEYLLESLVWLAAGALIGAGYHRWQGGGLLLTIPVGGALVVFAQGMIGTELYLPVLNRAAPAPGAPESVLAAAGTGLATVLVILAMTWALVRNSPLTSKPPGQ